MTTDFLISFDDGLQPERKAYKVMPTRREAETAERCDEFEIEKEYWAMKGVKCKLIVVEELNIIFLRNLSTMRQLRNISFKPEDLNNALKAWEEMLRKVEPSRKLQQLFRFEFHIGQFILNGFQVAILLLGKKKLLAPLEQYELETIKVEDVTEQL